MEYKYTSRSITDTMELAENIESEKFPGMVICLDGELGSGKTVFVKGFAKSLGITETITSPTFNLIKEYNRLYIKFSKKYHGSELEYIIKNKLYCKGFQYGDIKKEDLIV